MTFLEKAIETEKEDGLGLQPQAIMTIYCPSSYDFEDGKKCSATDKEKCIKCWNREMPSTEPKADSIPVIPQSEVDAYNKGHADGMAQGLNDAWELAKKVVRSPKLVENAQIFLGKNIVGIERESLLIQFFELTPQEALAKLKAYEDEQSKIKVGDVVFHSINQWVAVVTHIYHGTIIFGITPNGDTISNINVKDVAKTGKHLDIQSILEQIGE